MKTACRDFNISFSVCYWEPLVLKDLDRACRDKDLMNKNS